SGRADRQKVTTRAWCYAAGRLGCSTRRRAIIGCLAPFFVFLPRLELRTVTFHRLFVEIEYAGVARAAATVLVTGPFRWHWRRIVLGLGFGHDELDLVAKSSFIKPWMKERAQIDADDVGPCPIRPA